MNWQPIETAPKDGTSILVGQVGNRDVMQASWQVCRWIGGYWRCGRQGANGFDDTGAMQPTHWMPLPEPPNAP